MCICQTGSENNEHFFLHCPRHGNHRRDLLNSIFNAVDIDLGNLSSAGLCNLLLYGDSCFSLNTNRFIIESSIHFIKSTFTFPAYLGKPNCSHANMYPLIFSHVNYSAVCNIPSKKDLLHYVISLLLLIHCKYKIAHFYHRIGKTQQ